MNYPYMHDFLKVIWSHIFWVYL